MENRALITKLARQKPPKAGRFVRIINNLNVAHKTPHPVRQSPDKREQGKSRKRQACRA